MPIPPLPPALRAAACAAVLGIAACAQAPQSGPLPQATGPAPALVPLQDLLAQADGTPVAEPSAAALAARSARLQARAALMRGPVHDPATRARLATAIAAGAG